MKARTGKLLAVMSFLAAAAVDASPPGTVGPPPPGGRLGAGAVGGQLAPGGVGGKLAPGGVGGRFSPNASMLIPTGPPGGFLYVNLNPVLTANSGIPNSLTTVRGVIVSGPSTGVQPPPGGGIYGSIFVSSGPSNTIPGGTLGSGGTGGVLTSGGGNGSASAAQSRVIVSSGSGK